MAPTLPGEHFRIQCGDCQFCFNIDANNFPKSNRAVCPNCGFSKNSFKTNSVLPPAKANIITGRPINRWDLVAFRRPGSDGIENELIIKRVVGMPGEKVQIENGEVVIDGRIIAKPDRVLHSVKIPVFDSMYRPENAVVQRWKNEQVASSWQAGGKGWRFAGKLGQRQATDWMLYQHIRGYRHSGIREKVFPIEDSYAFNQNVARQLHAIDEVLLNVEAKLNDTAELTLQMQIEDRLAEATVSRNRIALSLRNKDGQILDSQNREQELLSASSTVQLSNFDGWLVLAVDAVPQAKLALPQTFNGRLQLRIGAANGEINLDRIQVFRDIVYLKSTSRGAQPVGRIHLSDDQYFLLGDNSPISIDSRSLGPVARGLIVGTVESGQDSNESH